MSILAIISAALVLLSACPMGSGRTYDAFQGKDQEAPKLLSYEMYDNSSIRLVYSEPVVLLDAEMNGIKLHTMQHGTIFSIPFPSPIARGEVVIFSVTAEDDGGNTSRSSLHLAGRNLEIPEALINELSVKGTAEAPDRVELLFLEEGSTAGMIIADGLIEDAEHYLILPDIQVQPYDLMVIYWDREPESMEPIYSGSSTGYIVYAGSDTTLSGTNGAVILYPELGGDIMDGIIYTTGESDLSDGYGNNRTRNAALQMLSSGEWEGDPVSSSLVTQSRVIARLPGAPDTNSADDFFITAARKSTFGTANEYFPYEE